MNKIKGNSWIVYVTVVLLVANIVTLSILWINNRHENVVNKRGGSLFEFICTELQFTDEQRRQYEKLKQQHREDIMPLQDSLRTSKEAFYSLLKQKKLSDSMATLQYDKVAVVEKNISMLNFKHFEQIRAICNATQQKKFDGILLEVVGRIGAQRPPGKRDEFGPPNHDMETMEPPPHPKGGDELLPPPIEN